MSKTNLERLGKELMCKGRLHMIETLELRTKSAVHGSILYKWKQAIQATHEHEAKWHLAHKNDYMLRFPEIRESRIGRER